MKKTLLAIGMLLSFPITLASNFEISNRVYVMDKSFVQESESNDLISSQIVGGETADIADFPFYARLLITDFESSFGHTCGGTILSDEYILTAAHCVDDEALEDNGYTINNLGIVINNSSFDDVALSEVKAVNAIYIHEDYDSITISNDIAVLHLSTPITEEFTAITLPTSTHKSEYKVLDSIDVTGMGYIDNSYTNPTDLLTTTVNKQTFEECETLISSIYGLEFPENKALCVLPYSENGSCNGDSGGPVTYNDDGTNQQIGLVSYGSAEGCALEGYPSVYTELYGFTDWISAKMVDEDTTDDDESGRGDIISDEEAGGEGGSFGLFGILGLLGLAIFRRKTQK